MSGPYQVYRRPPRPFAAWVKYLRIKLGWTQRELAKKIGVDGSIISLWEVAKRPVPEERLDDVAQILDVDPQYLDRECSVWPPNDPRDDVHWWEPKRSTDDGDEEETVRGRPPNAPAPKRWKYADHLERCDPDNLGEPDPGIPTHWKFIAKCMMCGRSAGQDEKVIGLRCNTCGGKMIYDAEY